MKNGDVVRLGVHRQRAVLVWGGRRVTAIRRPVQIVSLRGFLRTVVLQ